jgi:hypothetical protein
MDKPTRNIALVYGYSVCLVSVITFLICISSLVSSFSDLSDPLHSGFTMAGTPSLASYEIYKMDIMKNGQPDGNSKSASFTPDENALRSMYEAAKTDKIQKVRHDAYKAITIGIIMVLISVVLFLTHWKWMKSKNEALA